MRYKFQIISILVVLVLIVGLCFCGFKKDEISNQEYLRLHIRANSNTTEDQNIKYKVKNVVVDLLTPIVVGVKNKQELQEILLQNEKSIEQSVDIYLKENGFDYGCDMKINNEFFPTRSYQDVVLDADYYDALIINLGSGTGDNWWCVVYPPLCFVGDDINSKNIVYKSKLKEIIYQFFN